MKKELTILTCAICLLSSLHVSAQSYYEPNVDYVYRSKKVGSSTTTSVLTVRIDTNGAATVTRSESTSVSTDNELFQVLAPLTEITTGTNSGDGLGTVEISGDTTKYWIISFDNPTANRVGGTGIKIECICKIGTSGATCSVSYVLQNNVLNATCVQNSGCQTCEMKVTKTSTETFTRGGSLLLKANSVTIVN